MKITILAVACLCLVGCSAVSLDANYTDLVTKASAINHEAANRDLSPTEAKAIAAANAKLWDDILSASQGVTTTQPAGQ